MSSEILKNNASSAVARSQVNVENTKIGLLKAQTATERANEKLRHSEEILNNRKSDTEIENQRYIRNKGFGRNWQDEILGWKNRH